MYITPKSNQMNKFHMALLIIGKKLGEPEVNKLLETGKN
jgi:hypothetical protein